MTSAIRPSTICASLMFHGALFGIAVYFTLTTPAVYQVQAYKVSLGSVPMAAPAASVEAPAASTPPAQQPESPREEPPVPVIAETPVAIPEKTIATKSVEKKSKPKAAQQQPTTAQAKNTENTQQNAVQTGTPQGTGIIPHTVQGFSAYDAKLVDEPPKIARQVDPVYPRRAQKSNTEGMVIVEVVIDNQGHPCACKVVSAQPQGYFESAALKAAEKTRFIPGRLQGKAVKTVVHLPYTFKLT